MSFLFFLMPLFFIISFFYSAVGLGGGSAYIAVLAVSGITYTSIPTLALSLNLIASGSSWIGYKKSGYFQPALLLPLVIASVPAAFLGGAYSFFREAFFHSIRERTLFGGHLDFFVPRNSALPKTNCST